MHVRFMLGALKRPPLFGILIAMDPEIEEIKEMARKTLALAEDTHRMVRAMRRSARLEMVFRLVYWLAIVAVLGASYYFYVAPYVSNLEYLYNRFEQGINQNQASNQQTQQFIQGVA